MAPRKKESAEPTRRSTRTVSQSSAVTATESTSATKKRDVEEPTAPPEPKKAKKVLGMGDKLPDITLLDEDGNTVKIIDITFEKGFILFAYPRASTPGCTKQVSSSPPSVLSRLIGARPADFAIFSPKFLQRII